MHDVEIKKNARACVAKIFINGLKTHRRASDVNAMIQAGMNIRPAVAGVMKCVVWEKPGCSCQVQSRTLLLGVKPT